MILVVAAGLTACASHSHLLKGPGGIVYQWPPPAAVVSGPATTPRFCSLLIDDYQHLKTAQQGGGSATEGHILRDYIGMTPALESSAPPPIGPAVRIYAGAVSGLMQSLLAHGLDLLALPPGDLAPLSTPTVKTAAAEVASFSQNRCHYDLSANSTPVTRQGRTHA
jgi:hypothetical protein